jgi:hypothetical protein
MQPDTNTLPQTDQRITRLIRKFAGHAITLTHPETLLCVCDHCGAAFAPLIRPGGRLHRRWWHCPNQCNVGTGSEVQ